MCSSMRAGLPAMGCIAAPQVNGSVTVTVALFTAAVVVAQVVADGTTGGAAQASTYGRTGLAAHRAAQQRTAGRTQATADGGFGTVALACTYRTAGCAAEASADGRPRLA